jgi:hypothetical protein
VQGSIGITQVLRNQNHTNKETIIRRMINMVRYKKKTVCIICGDTQYYNSETEILLCKCGQVRARIVKRDLLEFYTKIPEVIIQSAYGAANKQKNGVVV